MLSSTKVKYKAIMKATKNTNIIKQLLQYIGWVQSIIIIIHCDNQSCIVLFQDHKFHAHTKHTEIHDYYDLWSNNKRNDEVRII